MLGNLMKRVAGGMAMNAGAPANPGMAGMDMFGQTNNTGMLSQALRGMRWPGRI